MPFAPWFPSRILYTPPHLSDFSDPLFPDFQPLNLESRCTLIGLGCSAFSGLASIAQTLPNLEVQFPFVKPHHIKTRQAILQDELYIQID